MAKRVKLLTCCGIKPYSRSWGNPMGWKIECESGQPADHASDIYPVVAMPTRAAAEAAWNAAMTTMKKGVDDEQGN